VSRLDREHDVIDLAKELGLSGDPVQAIVGFCQSRIDGWVADVGGVRTVDQLANMRVPESSVIHRLLTDGKEEHATGDENLSDWKFFSGSSLTDCEVWIEARRLPDRVIAIVQPTNVG